MLFLPIPGQPLSARFTGPYTVVSRVGDLNYLISTPDRRKGKRVCHVNMLKPFLDRETVEPQNTSTVLPMATVIRVTGENHALDHKLGDGKLKSNVTRQKFSQKVSCKNKVQKDKVKSNTAVFSNLCSDYPQRTHLKSVLNHAPGLGNPNSNKHFKLSIITSEMGMGAMLSQLDENNLEHPIGFHSLKFRKHEKVYNKAEKELLGLVLALRHFDFYINGSSTPIQVFTDHNPLVFLTRVKNNQRLLRWQLFLQSYNLSIHHIKGVDNIPADSLSRL